MSDLGSMRAEVPDACHQIVEKLQQDIEPLEEQIRALQQKVHALKYAQNQVFPVSRLPDEVLVEIFTYLIYDGPGTDSESSKWIRETTHVCSRWRQAALSSPRLWSSPSFVTPDCTTRMIERAKSGMVGAE